MIGWVVLIALATIGLFAAYDGSQLAKPVDSYICVQAETNRVPNPGCQSSKKELP